MNDHETWQKLINKLDGNYNDYMQKLLGLTSTELIDKAEEISAAKVVYNEIKNNGFGSAYREDAIYLLKYKNPLEVARDVWKAGLGYSLEAEIACGLGDFIDKRAAKQDYELDINETHIEPEQGMEMR